MSDQCEVRCHLCGKLFNIEQTPCAPEGGNSSFVTLYYCEECSEQKVDVTCRMCGKTFQELPIQGKGEEQIRAMCEDCSQKMLLNMISNPK